MTCSVSSSTRDDFNNAFKGAVNGTNKTPDATAPTNIAERTRTFFHKLTGRDGEGPLFLEAMSPTEPESTLRDFRTRV